MKPIPTMTTPALARPASLKPYLVCFSHLRWSFVWQRPQHLMVRAARDYCVIFFEDNPVFAAIDRPRLDLTQGPGAITIAVPVLPEGSNPMPTGACNGSRPGVRS